ncbi:MAG: (deoxy)nucleoside triphosphate pyrophosphohydrolase [Thermodesulfobacteria bacterium]|nr:(deoxy)nucleoside triphosphate pyrophosphohydrolase [Thermodesulfobacteriota bacterium]
MRPFPVVSAFIQRDSRILLARRPEGKLRGGLWEFPGGKLEEGESPEEALRREIKEELGVEAEVGRLLAEVEHRYPEVYIRLLCYETAIQGEPRPLEGQTLSWFLPHEIDDLPLAPADRKLWSVIKGKVLKNS